MTDVPDVPSETLVPPIAKATAAALSAEMSPSLASGQPAVVVPVSPDPQSVLRALPTGTGIAKSVQKAALITGDDTANPKGRPLPPSDWVLFYAGGWTPHKWTRADIAAQGDRAFLPAYVYGLGAADRSHPRANDEAWVCAAWLHELGVPRGVPVMIDMEGQIDPWFVGIFAEVLAATGRWSLVYGSKSSLFENPRRGGYMVADPTGHPHMYEHPHTVGTQWIFDVPAPDGLLIDKWVTEPWLLHHLWRPGKHP